MGGGFTLVSVNPRSRRLIVTSVLVVLVVIVVVGALLS
jgi:hypothetical protein